MLPNQIPIYIECGDLVAAFKLQEDLLIFPFLRGIDLSCIDTFSAKIFFPVLKRIFGIPGVRQIYNFFGMYFRREIPGSIEALDLSLRLGEPTEKYCN